MPYFQEHQDTLFIVVTAPPVSNGRYSSNARSFNQWLVNDWLKDYPYTNVAVFDFYNVLTTNGGNTDTSDVVRKQGIITAGGIILSGTVETGRGLSYVIPQPVHLRLTTTIPAAGNRKATGVSLPLPNLAYNRWQEG